MRYAPITASLLGGSLGFSMIRRTYPSPSSSTTPNRLGSSTSVTPAIGCRHDRFHRVSVLHSLFQGTSLQASRSGTRVSVDRGTAQEEEPILAPAQSTATTSRAVWIGHR